MRIESVTAHGFGPLVGQTLELAPGLTVVTGENESGKSSWHAATFAALCGRRRGRGRPTAPEQRFIDAHEPWSGARWAVSCLLTLDDGRLIELRQDLSGKVDCRATDTALARDVSAEIMVEGSPDASAWLGLTRTSFQATACVGQAEVLRVLAAADGLQHSLQQAASTAGTAGTAAAAIDQLEEVRRSAVGRDTAAAVRPLRKARHGVAAAEQRLAAAREARSELALTAADQGRLDEAVAATFARAEAADAEAAALGQPLVAARLPAKPQSLRPRGLMSGLTVGLAIAAAGLLLAAVLSGSATLAGIGVVAAVVCAASYWLVSRPAAPSAACGLAELRMEWAERQALATSARRRHHEATLRAGRADAVRQEKAAALPSTAEAEESLAAAQRELARVYELNETIELTIAFLSRAEERVHREVVPELTDLLRGWLPRLTGGRYVDARLDPATLAVEVCGPTREFRDAQLLSHGVTEQIYLLLRVALTEQLTAGHDTCPLLLDDVTVHADPVRCRQLLELLLELSERRQIVLFAHQDQVQKWADERLDGTRNCHVVLDPVRMS